MTAVDRLGKYLIHRLDETGLFAVFDVSKLLLHAYLPSIGILETFDDTQTGPKRQHNVPHMLFIQWKGGRILQ